jgi:hypothetical protein
MSGSGGGGGGTPDPEPPVSCEKLVINTQLSSPKLAALEGLVDGEALPVSLLQTPTGQVVVVTRNGQIAGGLAAPDLKRLRECLIGGTDYIAVVKSTNLGQYKVRVSAVGT